MAPSVSIPKEVLIIKVSRGLSPKVKLSKNTNAKKSIEKLLKQAQEELRGERMRYRPPEHPFFWFWKTIESFCRLLVSGRTVNVWNINRSLAKSRAFSQAGYNSACAQLFR